VNRYLFIFVDGTERRRAFVVTMATIAVMFVVFALIGFPWWVAVFPSALMLASVLLRPSAKTLELAKRSEPDQLPRGPAE
jgi:hypothetical protein